MEIAPFVTKAASRQTYYTIRFLVDRDRVADAYRAYAYFRWVDDSLDILAGTQAERIAFIERQKLLLECSQGMLPGNRCAQERMLVELMKRGALQDSGLQIYLCNLMEVMDFDARRRGRLISEMELSKYTHLLASAVSEAMHYFIGHSCYSPHGEVRYMAVRGAHVAHMLRDTFDDLQAGYFNIPREVLDANRISCWDVQSDSYRAWVRNRVQLARTFFKAGRGHLHRTANLRCRLAGFAYMARFEWLLDTIEKEGYLLRPEYSERKNAGAVLRMCWLALASSANLRGSGPLLSPLATHQHSTRE